MASDKEDITLITHAKQVSRTVLLTAVLVCGLCGAAGCEELFGSYDFCGTTTTTPMTTATANPGSASECCVKGRALRTTN